MEWVCVGVVLCPGKSDLLFGCSDWSLAKHGGDIGVLRVSIPSATTSARWEHNIYHVAARTVERSLGLAITSRTTLRVKILLSDHPEGLFTRESTLFCRTSTRCYDFVRFRDKLQGLRVSKKTPFYRRTVEPAVAPLERLLPTHWPTHSLVECASAAIRQPGFRTSPDKLRAWLPREILQEILASVP